MRQIVDGLLYDVYQSEKLFKVNLTYGAYKSTWIDVYKTKGGHYFKMNGWWGCAGSQTIEPLKLDEVIQLAARTGDVDLYEKISGRKVEIA